MVTALHSVIVLVRGGGDRRGGGGGGGGRGRGRGRRGRSVAGAGRVALGGSVVLCVGVVYEGNMGLRVLYPKLGVGHEIVDRCSRLGLLQPLIEGDGAAECIHHPDLSLDAIEASEPEDLSSAELPFGMVDLIHVLQLLQLIVRDLLFLGAVARCFQEF